MEIVLFQPEIPPNTGNIARLCAATQVRLHLIEPLGFSLDDRYLKRAGLDYWPLVDLHLWPNFDAFLKANPNRRLILTSAKEGAAAQQFVFEDNDVLVFGQETSGLPDTVYEKSPYRIRLPFAPTVRGHHDGSQSVRSLNLSTAAGIMLYLALDRVGTLDAWENNTA